MAVTGFVGHWGSGKTLMMVREVLLALDRYAETIVFNNFGLIHPNAVLIQGREDLRAACRVQLAPGWRRIIALDEIGMLFRSGTLRSFPPAMDVVFMQGRKLGIDVFWTTQHWRFLDVNIRRVTDKVCVCRPWLRVSSGRDEFGRSTGHPLMFSVVEYDEPRADAEELGAKHSRVRARLFRKRWASSYDTLSLINVAQALLDEGDEADVVANALLAHLTALRVGEDVATGVLL